MSSYWFKSEHFSLKVNNPVNSNHGIIEAFDALLERYSTVGVRKFEPVKFDDEPKALKITITDDHVGMDTNPDNRGLFSYNYNADVYRRSIEKVYQSILKEHQTHGTFELLLLDNLGDREDGWLGQTTRGGHSLSQNMTNAEVFDTIVDTKIALIESLVESKVANKIILRSCSNSNHSMDFAIIVNKAIQKVVNRLYSNDIVEVETLEKFIEHRYWGNHAFLLSHGKDAKHMFKGLPLILNDKAIKFINDYINFYKVKARYIHFEKGDLHQIGFQVVTNFTYRNFTSFAPASAWQQHNFGTSVSGYAIQVIPKWSNNISHTDYFLDYEKSE